MSVKILIYLLRNDLRLFDNPVLQEISRSYSSSASPFTHLLPLYVFRANQVEVSGFISDDPSSIVKSPYSEARSRIAGFWRCGHHRAKFLAESVWDLKKTFEERGCGLAIRAGTLEDVVKDVLQYIHVIDEAEITGVWMTGDHGFEEKQEEAAVKKIVEASEREFRLFDDNKYLIAQKDLPFQAIEDLPDVFSDFQKLIEPLREKARIPISDPIKLPPLPNDCIPPQFSPFTIPKTLPELVRVLLKPLEGINNLLETPQWPAETKSAYPFRGGEREGLRRLEHVLSSGLVTTYQNTWNTLMGIDSGTKLSAYLSLGCITTGEIHAEISSFEDGKVKKEQWNSSHEELTAKQERWHMARGFGDGESEGAGRIRAELAWRDYFRLVQCKFGVRIFALAGVMSLKLPKAEENRYAAFS